MPRWITSEALNNHRHVAGKGLSTDVVDATMSTLELRIERFHGRNWVPTSSSEQHRGDGSPVVWLDHPEARSLTSVTIDAISADTANFRLWRSGRLERRNGAFAWAAMVDVAYEHGADAPPDDLLDAAIRAVVQLVAHHANPRVGERTETIETPGGTVVNFAFLPDWQRGRPMGMPDVDAIIHSFGRDARPAIA